MKTTSLSRVLFLLCLLLAGATNAFAGETLDRIKQLGSVTLGFREDSVPFSYKNNEQGPPLGYSIDVCRALVETIRQEIGASSLAVNYVPVTGASRIPHVLEGKIDLECGNTTNTKARRESVAFAMPLYFASARMLVRDGSGIARFEDLEGKTLAVQKGTTGQQIAEARLARRDTTKVVIVANASEGVTAVESKTADAFITDDIVLHAFKAQSKEKLVVTGPVMSIEPLSIMFNKDDRALAAIVDRGMSRLVLSGQLGKLYSKWFESPLPQRSYNLTVEPNKLTTEILTRPSNYVADWVVL